MDGCDEKQRGQAKKRLKDIKRTLKEYEEKVKALKNML